MVSDIKQMRFQFTQEFLLLFLRELTHNYLECTVRLRKLEIIVCSIDSFSEVIVNLVD